MIINDLIKYKLLRIDFVGFNRVNFLLNVKFFHLLFISIIFIHMY